MQHLTNEAREQLKTILKDPTTSPVLQARVEETLLRHWETPEGQGVGLASHMAAAKGPTEPEVITSCVRRYATAAPRTIADKEARAQLQQADRQMVVDCLKAELLALQSRPAEAMTKEPIARLTRMLLEM